MILIVLISLGFADIYAFWIQYRGVLSHKVAFQIFLFLLLLYLIIGCIDFLLFLFYYHVKLRFFFLRHFTHQEFIYDFLNVFVVLKINSFNRLAVMGASQHLENLLDVVFVLRGGYLRRALGIALSRRVYLGVFCAHFHHFDFLSFLDGVNDHDQKVFITLR